MEKKKRQGLGFFRNELPLHDAIDMAVARIMGNHMGFFIHTEFGRIGVETCKKDNDVYTGVWKTAPFTSFREINRFETCDYYISVPRRLVTNHNRTLECFIAQEMLKLLVCDVTDMWPTREQLDVMLLAFLKFEMGMSRGDIITAYVSYKFDGRIGSNYARELAAIAINERCEKAKLFMEVNLKETIKKLRNDQRMLLADVAPVILACMIDLAGAKNETLPHEEIVRQIERKFSFTDMCSFYSC